MAADVDRGIAIGGRFPFTGDDLRRHYARLLELHPAEAVLADAERRWRAQVVCDLVPLVDQVERHATGSVPPEAQP